MIPIFLYLLFENGKLNYLQYRNNFRNSLGYAKNNSSKI